MVVKFASWTNVRKQILISRCFKNKVLFSQQSYTMISQSQHNVFTTKSPQDKTDAISHDWLGEKKKD